MRFNISQSQLFDKFAQEKLGIPSIILMENAGRNAAEEALKMLKAKKNVAIVCGVGNNGGDGFVCARHLLNQGINVKVYIVGDINKIKKDAEINLNILRKLAKTFIALATCPLTLVPFVGSSSKASPRGASARGGQESRKGIDKIRKSDLIIDAIFGIGLNSKIKEPYFSVIRQINESKIPILSIDVPSGLDADRGVALRIAVKAKKTVTFVAPKIGFYKKEGPKYCGKIVVRDIGIIKNLSTRKNSCNIVKRNYC